MVLIAKGRDREAWALWALVAVVLLATGAASGGYYPEAWGWATIACAWAAGLAVILTRRIVVSRPAILATGSMFGFAAWSLVSLAWSPDQATGVQDVQRDLLYATAMAAAVLLNAPAAAARISAAVLAASAGITLYGLAAWLAPDRLGLTSDPHSPGRLSAPIGYWNAEGALAAIAIVLALATAASTRPRLARALAAGLLPMLAAALYLTLSRGAIVAAAVGVAVWLACAPRRTRAAALALALAPAPVAAAALAHGASALSGPAYGPRSAAAGHRLGLELLALGIVAAVVWPVVMRLEPRIPEPRWAPLRWGRRVLVAAVLALVAAVVLAGGPGGAGRVVARGFTGAPPARDAGSGRVMSVSSNGRVGLWDAAWHDFTGAPVAGIGAGGFESSWLRVRHADQSASRWAHSLPLETLAETGALGLVLLAVAIGTPLVAGLRAGRSEAGAGAIAVVAVFAVHSAADWDWQVPTVTLAAIWCATSLLPARPDGVPLPARRVRPVLVAVAAAIVVAAAVGLAGAQQLAAAQHAAAASRPRAAIESARRAADLEPWSYLPWMTIGQSDAALGRVRAARAAYGVAVARGPDRWDAWLALASVTSGARRAGAVAHVAALDPAAWQLRAFCRANPGAGCPPAGVLSG
jgi:hypothetical protein